ncbi:hypothetical protein AOQ84DRAFT_294328 [Glonium stellatum]|uniref:Uncharacterized protein n=1 Tax=Glonium stellatum TaxID=574774 RepID=A0A8E2JSC2_9PEZI|nr:hypothetical protein AOQ84DRAFT_294328 [Glonium stellatum]
MLNKGRGWCGTAIVDESWAEGHDDQLYELIALSDARKFTDYECTSWAYTIPKDLEDIYGDLYHAMRIDYIPDP